MHIEIRTKIMEHPHHFVVIDDDALNNKICRVCIEKSYSGVAVATFTDPIAGFNHVANAYNTPGSNDQITVFLDIKMPTMDAWEFLDRFDMLDEEFKRRVKIYILSSSVDKRDMERAQANRNVVYYLIKPLTIESIRLLTLVQKKKGN